MKTSFASGHPSRTCAAPFVGWRGGLVLVLVLGLLATLALSGCYQRGTNDEQRGRNDEPDGGNSCTDETCVRVCKSDGRNYLPGEDVPIAADECKACTCAEDGTLACKDVSCCSVDDKFYGPREQFPAQDSCNVCICDDDGQISCTHADCQSGGYEGCGPHAVGESVKVDSECQDCSCLATGEVACPRKACQCEHKGKTYARGETFSDSCHSCRCDSTGVVCSDEVCETCEANGRTYQFGEGYFDGVACRSCYCGGICYTHVFLECSCPLGDSASRPGERVVWTDGCNTAQCVPPNTSVFGQWELDAPVKICPALPKIAECEDDTGTLSARPVYRVGDALGLTIQVSTCSVSSGKPDVKICFKGPIAEAGALDVAELRVVPLGPQAACEEQEFVQVWDLSPLADARRQTHGGPSGSLRVRFDALGTEIVYSF